MKKENPNKITLHKYVGIKYHHENNLLVSILYFSYVAYRCFDCRSII